MKNYLLLQLQTKFPQIFAGTNEPRSLNIRNIQKAKPSLTKRGKKKKKEKRNHYSETQLAREFRGTRVD